jgi:tripartite-type tricarboxylate transporter receptor subunit TctC
MIGRRALPHFGAALGAALGTNARAADWPTRPVRVVVPFAAGGSSDICARLGGRQLQAATGQPFVIENIAGGNGVVGTLAVLQAPADGYTLTLGASTTMSMNPHLMRNPGYDAERDFAAVGVFGITSAYLMVAANAPWPDLAALIAAIRARPGALNAGWFNGSSRVPAELLKRVGGGLDFETVAYKVIGNAITDLQSGQLQFVFIDMVAADAHLASGRFRALAVTGAERLARFPELPAMREFFAGFETGGYIGMAVRSSTPLAVQAEINRQFVAAVRMPELSNRLREMSMEPVAMDLETAAAYTRREREKYGRIIRLAGIEPE